VFLLTSPFIDQYPVQVNSCPGGTTPIYGIAVYQACGIVTEACGVDGGHRAMKISEHGNMK